jgi:MFS family permease
LFKNSIFSVSTLVTMIFGMALFGGIFFIPLYVQGVVGSSATSSGLILTPLMLTSVVGSVVSGQLVSRLGRYKWIAILGMLVSVAGVLLLARLDVHSSNNDVLLAMLVLGLGLGIGMSLYTLIVQNALPGKIGQSTAALTFFRQIGGTVALAIVGTIFTTSFLEQLGPQLTAAGAPQNVATGIPAAISSGQLDANLLTGVGDLGKIILKVMPQLADAVPSIVAARNADFSLAVAQTFWIGVVAAIVAALAAAGMQELALRRTTTAQAAAADGRRPAVPAAD